MRTRLIAVSHTPLLQRPSARGRIRLELAVVPQRKFATGNRFLSSPGTLELRWKVQLGEMIKSTAAIVNGRVYVGALSGELLCSISSPANDSGHIRPSNRSIPIPLPQDLRPLRSSPPSAYLSAMKTACFMPSIRDRKKLWTFETTAEIISSASVYEIILSSVPTTMSSTVSGRRTANSSGITPPWGR